MRLKEDTSVEESAELSDHDITIELGKIMYTEAKCASCFAQGMTALMNLGSTFADYVSVVSGIDGIEALIVSQSIFETIELPLEPENYLDDMLTHLQADPDAVGLHIDLTNLEDNERAAIMSVIKAYFASADNGFKPSNVQIQEHLKSELPQVVRDIIDNIIKKQKAQGK